MPPRDNPPGRSRRRRLVAVLPNLLSSFRLVLACAFPLLPDGWRLAAVIAGGLSDWADGYLARRFDLHSRAGVLLDAIADKLLVFSVLLTLAFGGDLDLWQVLLVMARDLSVAFVAGYVALQRDWAAFHRLVPRLPGKLTTGLQFALFLTILIWDAPAATMAVFAITALCSVAAGADYLRQFGIALRERG